MRNILYLTFYYEPDLCAGSFRNTPLVKELAKQVGGSCRIDVLTTVPNRYKSFTSEAPEEEQHGNLYIKRIKMPLHSSGFADQINSFWKYFFAVRKFVAYKNYDMVVVSSSRLFTAYLGYTIAHKRQIPLYLDIRDIFVDTINDVIPNRLVKLLLMPILKFVEKRTFSFATHINLISGGFRKYFEKYAQAKYSYFTNGIDEDFILDINDPDNFWQGDNNFRTITYAGNIGEGQGLHKIIPELAKQLGDTYHVRIIGDGGAVRQLKVELEKYNLTNVSLEKPVKRKDLINIYRQSDFIFVHLNDYAAFEKVLPSKIFEAGAFPRPMLAGVSGYARSFIEKNVDNVILFTPGKPDELVAKLRSYQYHAGPRKSFIESFRRESINKQMAFSILQYLPL
ncbi:MAG: glycosyltransferase family 4 protein [Sediminibacterium sp.]